MIFQKGWRILRAAHSVQITMACIVVTALAGISHAQAPKTTRVDIVETGIYRATVTGSEAAAGTATGSLGTVTNEKLVQATTRIPARIGVRFGMRYRIVGQPAGAVATLKFVGRIPAPGQRNPATGNTMMRQEFSTTARMGEVKFNDFSFDESWELVTGTWTFEIWDGNRKLASQNFEVFKP